MTAEARPMIEMERLSKRFGAFTAVDDLSLQIRAGEIFGFLGPNGAGKTTTIKMLAGLLKPSSGRIRINGRDLAREPVACKQVTGYIPDRPYLYEKLTGIEYLQFIASLYRLKPAAFNANSVHLLDLFGLSDRRHQLIESYSHGMRQKLIMASILMLDPPIIIVDEPMVGLDPKSARIVKELFRARARAGTAIFLSTHSLEIAEELCDRIGIIVNSALRIVGNLATLRQEARMEESDLEEIFLELTGVYDVREVVNALRAMNQQNSGEQ
ncbi:MAG: ABC transporter ATP-binding protein [Desulfobacterales bacterium]|nr:ABC transporter ATP-binding protein [Desulfobacterales bacterium]